MKIKATIASFGVVCGLTISQAILAQDVQYGRGLLLDYYIIQSEEDVKEPSGRSMATLVDTSAPELSYLAPFEIEPALNQFNDQFWGLRWSGFLQVETSGQYSFNLQLNISGNDTRSRYGADCTSWLKIQDRKLVAHEHSRYSPGNSNAYGDLQLRPGVYEFEAWLACSQAGGGIDHGEAQGMQLAKPVVIVNMRGPNDAMLRPIPKNQLLHEL